MSLDHKLEEGVKSKAKPMAFIAVTRKGKALAYKLREAMQIGDIYVSAKLEEEGVYTFKESLKAEVGRLFKQYEALVFIMATGIVVRSIAPYIESKFTDPAVVVLDEEGNNVISLLSGHMGGANELTRKISQLISAHPVITTATDVHEMAALDNIAKYLNAYIADFRESVKDVNYALVHGEKVGLYCEELSEQAVDERGFIKLSQVDLEKGTGICEKTQELIALKELKMLVYITRKQLKVFDERDGLSKPSVVTSTGVLPRIIKVVPRDLVLGMGCRRNTDILHFRESFYKFLDHHQIDEKAIVKIGSIDLKKDESAMQDLARYLQVPFEIIDRKDILEVEDLFEKSEFVKQHVGVYNVAEPVAYLLSGKQVLVHKEKHEGTTFAMGKMMSEE